MNSCCGQCSVERVASCVLSVVGLFQCRICQHIPVSRYTKERNVTVFEHPATGIRVWSEVGEWGK